MKYIVYERLVKLQHYLTNREVFSTYIVALTKIVYLKNRTKCKVIDICMI